MHIFKTLCVATLLTIAVSPSHAGLLEVLRDNGSISAQQYAELSGEKKRARAKASELRIVGRLYADFAHYQEDETPLASGGELRTARLQAKGKYRDNWKYKVQFSVEGDALTSRYIWLGYQFENSIVKVGRTAEANGMEDYTSSLYITFMERALPVTAFEDDFAEGVEYNWWNNYSGLQVSALLNNGKPSILSSADENGDGVVDANDTISDSSADEKFKLSARYSIAPLVSNDHIIHLGLHANYVNPPDNTHRTRTRPESHVTDTRLLDSGELNGVNGVSVSGIEFAWIGGPLSVQAEYLQQDISIQGAQDINYDGFYIFGSYFISGHTRNYDAGSGTVGRTALNGKGAIELALRYSSLDLGESNAGEGSNITAGINWWPRSNIKLAFNQIFADFDMPGSAADEHYGISQVRAQIDF